MAVTAALLRELHRLRRQLADLRERHDRGPKQIRAHEANVKRAEDEAAKVKADATAARKAVDAKHLTLRSKEDKINGLQGKLSACSTNREYQALTEQIAADKVAMSVLEDEILDSLGKVDEFKVHVATAEQHVDKAKEEAAKVRASVDAQRASLESEMARIEAELKEKEVDLPDDFRQNYERIVRAKGDDALAEVEGDCCGGCYQQLTPNMVSHLKLAVAIACKSCGRLLYYPESEVAKK
jgi:predicted  nucleic acid-binding Zn-ribbon protein